MFPSIADIFNLSRDDPKEQSLANNLIKRFDREHFQKLVVNWIVDSQQSFQQAETLASGTSSNILTLLFRLRTPTSRGILFGGWQFDTSRNTRRG